MRLKGRIAVISGASGGLGQAIAVRLAEEGADIAIIDRQSSAESAEKIRAVGVRCLDYAGDVSAEADVAGFAAQVRQSLGPCDIVVNNAAIMGKYSFDQLTLDIWQNFFAVNVNGQFLMARTFLADLKRSAAGRVINIASSSVWRSVPLMIPYIAAKGAVLGFTNSLATELGPHGVTVNAIAPGIVRTPGMAGLDGAEDTFAMVSAMQVIKRDQEPADAAAMAAFLASDEASFITGQVLVVDGGLTRR
jgi:NAD(P)-dependent dehydrogenase (short-subunit alcohol dehydrogenase family)